MLRLSRTAAGVTRRCYTLWSRTALLLAAASTPFPLPIKQRSFLQAAQTAFLFIKWENLVGYEPCDRYDYEDNQPEWEMYSDPQTRNMFLRSIIKLKVFKLKEIEVFKETNITFVT